MEESLSSMKMTSSLDPSSLMEEGVDMSVVELALCCTGMLFLEKVKNDYLVEKEIGKLLTLKYKRLILIIIYEEVPIVMYSTSMYLPENWYFKVKFLPLLGEFFHCFETWGREHVYFDAASLVYTRIFTFANVFPYMTLTTKLTFNFA